jgi:hypothetical protein
MQLYTFIEHLGTGLRLQGLICTMHCVMCHHANTVPTYVLKALLGDRGKTLQKFLPRYTHCKKIHHLKQIIIHWNFQLQTVSLEQKL